MQLRREISQMCEKDHNFNQLLERSVAQLEYDKEDMEKLLPKHLLYSVLCMNEVLHTEYTIKLLFWLCTESPFSIVVRMIMNTLQNEVDNRMKGS